MKIKNLTIFRNSNSTATLVLFFDGQWLWAFGLFKSFTFAYILLLDALCGILQLSFSINTFQLTLIIRFRGMLQY